MKRAKIVAFLISSIFFSSEVFGSEKKINIDQILLRFDEPQEDSAVLLDEEFRRETTDTLGRTVKRGMVFAMQKPSQHDTQLFDLELK